MCGISGIISRKNNLTRDQLLPALNCLHHRGPESESVWLNPSANALLGHNRLSIIDLSPAASQPMHLLGRYTIIHNGEIYNYLELKKLLLQKGYEFHSASDTEVIAIAYDAWGADCLQKFDGMFAFAIWDEKEKDFFAARDRFGEKPFYYSCENDQLIFASEVKALWKIGIKKEVNDSMLYNFLTIGYTSNPSEPGESFYNGILKLPPASYLKFSSKNGETTIAKYWEVEAKETISISEEEAIEKFRHLFSASIEKRLRSDVSIGTSLSGGIDSSSVVAFSEKIAAANYTHKCFTASFEGFEKDETDQARKLATEFGLEHHMVTISENEVADLMKEVMYFQEEPFSSGSVLAQYRVYGEAKKQGVTVLLDGQGADEILGGYQKYYRWYWQELYRQKKLSARGEIAAAHELGVKEKFLLSNRAAALLPEFTAAMLQSRKAKQAFQHRGLNRDYAFSNKRNSYYSLPADFTLNGALYFDSFVYGLEELLKLADRNSMAHATEVRLPFLNHELVSFLFSLPPSLKIHKGWTKWLLRKSVENLLPEETVWKRGKIGFEPPQEQWMKNKNVQDSIFHGKKKLVDQGILNPDVLKKIKPHSSYAADNNDWKYWSASFLFGD